MSMTDPLSLRRRPAVLADLVPGELAADLLLIALAAGLIGALAQLSVHLPGTPVPVTGQTLGVLLAAPALGRRRAVAASGAYLVLGFLGVPWFAGHAAGWAGATSGYLFGFVVASAACGRLAERGADRTVWRAIPTMLLGECCIFACGVGFLALDLHLGAAQAIALGLTPFLVGEVTKLTLAAGALPAAWRLVARVRR